MAITTTSLLLLLLLLLGHITTVSFDSHVECACVYVLLRYAMSIAERQQQQLISKLDRNSMNVQYVLRSVRTFSHRLNSPRAQPARAVLTL